MAFSLSVLSLFFVIKEEILPMQSSLTGQQARLREEAESPSKWRRKLQILDAYKRFTNRQGNVACGRDERNSDEHDSEQGNDGLWRDDAGDQCGPPLHHHRAERASDYWEKGPTRFSVRRV